MLDKYDLLFIGAPCHNSTLAKPIQKFLSKLPDSSTFKFAGFYTHSTVLPQGSERNKQLFDRWAGKCHEVFEKTANDKKIEFFGDFHCQGSANFFIEKFIHLNIITDKEEWNKFKPMLRKHPTQEDFDNVQQFTDEILSNF